MGPDRRDRPPYVGLRLAPREWLLAGAASFAFAVGLPIVWDLWPDPPPDEPVSQRRIPYALSEDYWLFERFAARAARDADVLLLGDSVVWGAYAERDATLAHFWQERDGRRFANLGVHGGHPAALDGILRYHGEALARRLVVLHCNLLWMSSPRQDLSDAKEAAFNHERVVPQLDASLTVYRADLSTRLGIALERRVPLLQLARHLQATCFDQLDFPTWTIENPYRLPAAPHAGDPGPAHAPGTWTERGLVPASFEWVDLEGSVQWRFFRSAVDRLRRNGNRVVVLVGPFNEHMLTAAGRARHDELRSGVLRWLASNGVETLAPGVLPSELYADASHPLAAGYRQLARQLDVPR